MRKMGKWSAPPRLPHASASGSASSESSVGTVGKPGGQKRTAPRGRRQVRPSSESSDIEVIARSSNVIEVIELLTSSSEGANVQEVSAPLRNTTSASSKKKGKEKMEAKEGHVCRIRQLHNKVASADKKISALEQKLKKEKAKKKALQRKLEAIGSLF